MGTSWASVITDDALLLINDLRLNTELAENPALFFRKMAFYMMQAIPRFNRPPEMQGWLSFRQPMFDSLTVTAEQGQTTVDSGKTGFELMCAGKLTADVYGNPVYTPISDASYDPETGTITLSAPAAMDDVLSFDFYSDGSFDNTLTVSQRRILALCLQYVWETAFVNDWLNRVPRAKDRSFDAGNVANQTRSNTERISAVKKTLDDELAKYEQDNAYMMDFRQAQSLY